LQFAGSLLLHLFKHFAVGGLEHYIVSLCAFSLLLPVQPLYQFFLLNFAE
jgi:hypothetical protein